MRLVPLLLLPLIPLILFVGVFVFIQLGMGYSIDQIRIQLADLWQVYFPYLNASTVVIGVPILAFTLWNSGVVKKLAGQQKKS